MPPGRIMKNLKRMLIQGRAMKKFLPQICAALSHMETCSTSLGNHQIQCRKSSVPPPSLETAVWSPSVLQSSGSVSNLLQLSKKK